MPHSVERLAPTMWELCFRSDMRSMSRAELVEIATRAPSSDWATHGTEEAQRIMAGYAADELAERETREIEAALAGRELERA